MSIAATISAPLTGRGTILGTLQYMSPEQIEGRETDSRSDLFALGAIVYEMATGKRAFEGNSPASVMAAILERQPSPMSSVQPLLPASLDHVVARCLAKHPDERWQSAGDVMRELQWIAETRAHSGEIAHAPGRPTGRERYLWISAVAVLSIVAAAALAVALRPAAAAPERRLEITPPATDDPFSFAISPDGEKVAVVVMGDGRLQLWLRRLKSGSAQLLKGTDGAQYPFWSPDSRQVGFGASGQLKRIDLESGNVQKVANAPLFLGGTWNTDGTIIFAANSNSPLMRVSSDSGDAAPVTTLGSDDAHSFPHALPDGRHFLFYARPRERAGVYIGQIDGTPARRLLDADAAAIYAYGGYLLFARKGSLLAQRFDPERLTPSGDAVSVADQIVLDRLCRVAPRRTISVGCRTNPLSKRPHDRCPGPSPGHARRPRRKRPRQDCERALRDKRIVVPRRPPARDVQWKSDLATGPRDPEPASVDQRESELRGRLVAGWASVCLCVTARRHLGSVSEGRNRRGPRRRAVGHSRDEDANGLVEDRIPALPKPQRERQLRHLGHVDDGP